MSTEAQDLDEFDPYVDDEPEDELEDEEQDNSATVAELDSETEAEETEEVEEDTSLTVGEVDDEGFDARAVASSFRSSGAGGRVAIWQGLSDEERTQVAEALETPSQVQEPSLEGFEPRQPTDKDFGRTVQVSKSSLFGKIGRVRSGGLPASPAIRSQIEGFFGKAASVPESHPDFHESVQRGAHLITQLEAAERGSHEFGQVKKTSQTVLIAGEDGFTEQIETDQFGNQRIRVFPSRQMQEAKERRTKAPWDKPGDVTLENFNELSMAEKMRFKKEFPDHWNDLLYRQSLRMDEQLRTNKGVSG